MVLALVVNTVYITPCYLGGASDRRKERWYGFCRCYELTVNYFFRWQYGYAYRRSDAFEPSLREIRTETD